MLNVRKFIFFPIQMEIISCFPRKLKTKEFSFVHKDPFNLIRESWAIHGNMEFFLKETIIFLFFFESIYKRLCTNQKVRRGTQP